MEDQQVKFKVLFKDADGDFVSEKFEAYSESKAILDALVYADEFNYQYLDYCRIPGLLEDLMATEEFEIVFIGPSGERYVYSVFVPQRENGLHYESIVALAHFWG
jgi:hypothetical protein